MDKDHKKIETLLNNHSDKIINEFKDLRKKIESNTEFLKQKQEFSSMETTTISLLVALFVISYTYIATTEPNDLLSVFFFLFSLIIGIGASMLLLTHIVVYFKRFDRISKEIIFTIDVFILFFLILTTITVWIIAVIYAEIGITSEGGSIGQIFFAIIITVEIIANSFISFKSVPKYLKMRFPLIFTNKRKEIKKEKTKSNKIKSNPSIWKGHDSFNE